MPPEAMEVIGAMVSVISLGTLVLLGMRMRYKYKLMREAPEPPEALQRMTEVVDALYDQTCQLREDVTALQERLDFHERLLTQPSRETADTSP
jgi:hypothetical protein